MNLNKMAQRVAKREGKKVQVNIAQIKEVMRCFIEELEKDGAFVVQIYHRQSRRKNK